MKNKTTWLQKRAGAKIGKPGFETQRLLLRLTEGFAARMEKQRVRRADLARELGVDRSMVTRLLNGDQNVTIKTLVAMASALDCRLDFELQDLQSVRETGAAGSCRLSSVAPILEFLNRPLLNACSNLPLRLHDTRISSGSVRFSGGGAPKCHELDTSYYIGTTTLIIATTEGVSMPDPNAWIQVDLKGECDSTAA